MIRHSYLKNVGNSTAKTSGIYFWTGRNPKRKWIMNEMEGSKSHRQPVIDVIKGMCIIFVIITHYGWDDKQRLAWLFPFFIDMAVPIFMIVSGYTFTASYLRKGIDRFEDAYDSTIISKRIFRYTIPFLMAYIIEVICFYFIKRRVNILEIITTFFIGGWGPGSYYYPEMIQITFFLPVILYSIRKKPKSGLIFWFIFNAFYEFIKNVVGLDTSIYRLSLFRYTFLLAFGCYIYLNREKKINKVYLILSLIVGITYILATKYWGYQTKIINNEWCGTSFMAALYIAPIVMLIIYKFGSFSWRPIEFIGKASYNIFLTQLVYYCTASRIIVKITSYMWVHVILNIFICVFVGIIFYLIEGRITSRVLILVDHIINKVRIKTE